MGSFSSMSIRDRSILLVAGSVLIFLVLIVLWLFVFSSSWKTSRKKYNAMHKTRVNEYALVMQKEEWKNKDAEERGKLPKFSLDKNLNMHWLSKINSIAEGIKKEDYFSIPDTRVTSEKNVDGEVSGDDDGEVENTPGVYECDIEVKNWKATLPALVKFAHALQSAEDAMFDIREITIDVKKGYLQGSLTISCAYMRDDLEEEETEEKTPEEESTTSTEEDAPQNDSQGLNNLPKENEAK